MNRCRTVDVLGVPVSAVTGAELLAECDAAVADGTQRVFAYANAHAINLARGGERFARFLRAADVVYPDGQGVRLAAWLFGSPLPPPTALTRWVWDLAAHCEQQGYSLFLLGSTEPSCIRAVRRLNERFPNLRVEGHHGFFDRAETPAILNRIAAFAPHIILVGFGMPTQEYWIEEHRSAMNASVIFPGGSVIDFVSGTRIAAPAWISRVGLEWLFRLAAEPRRLFARYIFGNAKFMFAVIMTALSGDRTSGGGR